MKNSKKILIKKYLKEFDDIAQKLGVGDEPESQIHYTQFLILMQKMCFVHEDNQNDEDMLKTIWSIIHNQNGDNYCRKHSLKVV